MGGIGVVIVKCVGLLGYIWADYIYVLDAVAYFVDSDDVDVVSRKAYRGPFSPN